VAGHDGVSRGREGDEIIDGHPWTSPSPLDLAILRAIASRDRPDRLTIASLAAKALGTTIDVTNKRLLAMQSERLVGGDEILGGWNGNSWYWLTERGRATLDAADSLGLAWWWAERQKLKAMAGVI
jgi:hypothetical protein